VDVSQWVDGESGQAESPTAERIHLDSTSGELPVDPGVPPLDVDRVPPPTDMNLSAGLSGVGDKLTTLAAPDVGVPVNENGVPGVAPTVDPRPAASGPAPSPAPVQIQTMNTGGQPFAANQEPAPSTPSVNTTGSKNDAAPSMVRGNPSGVGNSSPEPQPQSPAPREETAQAVLKNPMESAGQRQVPGVEAPVERPGVALSAQPAPETGVPQNQIGNPMESGGQAASHQSPQGRFQERDASRSPQHMEAVETEKNSFSTAMTSESAKTHAVDPSKAPPVFQDTAKTSPTDTSASSAVKMAETPEKTFQTTVMDQIVDRARLRSVQGRSEVQIRLKPEHLGNVQMHISTDKDQVVVRIMTDQPVVKEIIETHLHHLKTELGNQGMTIDRIDVSVNPDADNPNQRDAFTHMFKNNSSRDGQHQARNGDRQSDMHEDEHEPDDARPGREGVNYFA
jgi:flagellar hook-length control protein FliK